MRRAYFLMAVFWSFLCFEGGVLIENSIHVCPAPGELTDADRAAAP